MYASISLHMHIYIEIFRSVSMQCTTDQETIVSYVELNNDSNKHNNSHIDRLNKTSETAKWCSAVSYTPCAKTRTVKMVTAW